jgi:hypothetical protein
LAKTYLFLRQCDADEKLNLSTAHTKFGMEFLSSVAMYNIDKTKACKFSIFA